MRREYSRKSGSFAMSEARNFMLFSSLVYPGLGFAAETTALHVPLASSPASNPVSLSHALYGRPFGNTTSTVAVSFVATSMGWK